MVEVISSIVVSLCTVLLLLAKERLLQQMRSFETFTLYLRALPEISEMAQIPQTCAFIVKQALF